MKQTVLAAQSHLLDQLHQQAGLLQAMANLQPATVGPLGVESLLRRIEELHNEAEKIRRLEVVLTVVGTMKAGKSTLINALVGQELLPNRNLPMTTLPTLIRHVPGRREPRLCLQQTAALVELAEQVGQRLLQRERDDSLDELDSSNQPDGQALIVELLQLARNQGGLRFAAQHEGMLSLRNELQRISDLFRLAQELGIPLDGLISAYDDIDEIPVIEVEFAHLATDQAAELGRLALLDTPGPDEAGQGTTLREILSRQLQRASIVLLVVNYTQQNSDADAEVRDEVSRLRTQLGDRLHVAVNKFDGHREAEDGSESDLRRLVAGRFGLDAESSVHLVSALQALLAQQAERAFNQAGHLPDPDSETWVSDFGDAVFGKRWRRDIADAAKLQEGIGLLWKDSRFPKLIGGVLEEAYERAAMISLEAAENQICVRATELEQALGLRVESLNQSPRELRQALRYLERHLGQLEQAQQSCEPVLQRALEVNKERIAHMFLIAEEKLRAGLAHHLFVGSRQLAAEAQRIQELARVAEQQKQEALLGSRMAAQLPTFAKGFKALKGRITENASEQKDTAEAAEVPPNFADVKSAADLMRTEGSLLALSSAARRPAALTTLNFAREEDANALAANLQGLLRELFRRLLEAVQTDLGSAISRLESELEQRVQATVSAIEDELRVELNGRGFTVTFSFPRISLRANVASVDSRLGALAPHTHQREEVREELQNRDGVSGAFGRWIGGVLGQEDWGRESVPITHQVTEHGVDFGEWLRAGLRQLRELHERYEQACSRLLQSAIRSRLDQHFGVMQAYLDGLHQGLIVALEDQSQSQLRQDALKKKLTALLGRNGAAHDSSPRAKQDQAKVRSRSR